MFEPYQLIYCDPPWTYRDQCHAGQRGAGYKYTLMTLAELKALPVAELADPRGSLLAMWWVPPMPQEALDVVKAWGFTLKTMQGFTWHKKTKHGKDHFGMGNYTRCLRGDTEVYLQETSGRVFIDKMGNLGVHDLTKITIWTPSGWQAIRDYVKREFTPVHRIDTTVGSLCVSSNHTLVYKEPISTRLAGHKHKRRVVHEVRYGTIDDMLQAMNKSLVKANGHSVNLLFSERPVESSNPITTFEGINLSEELAWIIGLFCAEGSFCTRGQQTRFDLHADEVDFFDRIRAYVESLQLPGDRYFNSKIEAKRYMAKDRNSMTVYFNSKAIKAIIEHFVVGKGAHGKRLNLDLFLQTTAAFRRSFLQGALDGDGHLEQGRRWKIFLCNRDLINDLHSLTLSVGIPSSVYLDCTPAIKNGTICERHGLRFYSENSEVDLSIGDTKCRTMTIKGVAKDVETCDTFDICVDGELFIANNLVTHNSNAECCLFATVGKPKRVNAGVRSLIEAPVGAHSQKPPEARQRLEMLLGNVRRIELFARTPAAGWDSVGNALDGMDITVALRKKIEGA